MIRSATLLDIPKILTLVEQFYPQTSYAQWAPFDEETVKELITILCRRGILLVAQVDDSLVGILGVIGMPFIFNKNLISGHEVVWWITPDYRNGSLGKDMLRRVDQIRQLKGWASLQMVRLETSSPVLDRFFKSEGFLPTEYCFTKVN